MSRHLMLVPSLACPASCAYCFGPHAGGPPMTQATVEAVVRWQNALGDEKSLEITFHGGEPLVPGANFYRMALPLLRDGLSPRRVRFGLQSNLWLLTDELCELFREYGVSIGTSLDGPELINDAQRGQGYFRRTMAGIERARAHGLDVGCICTFTAQSAPHADEIFDFFVGKGLDFSIHAALPSLSLQGSGEARGGGNGWHLSPEFHGELLVNMLDRYLANLDKIRISTLDSMCRSISADYGGICTFGDCLGDYLAVTPNGDIYSCQRFIGMEQYYLGNVHTCPTMETLSATPAWHVFQDRQDRIASECGGCAHLNFCRGGCPYSVLVASGGEFNGTLRDPHCPAYKRVFSYATDRALAEVFSEENLDAVVTQGPSKYGLMRKGKLLQIMRGGPHPQEVSMQARKVVAAVALAASNSPEEAVEKLDRAGLVTDPVRALQSVTALQAQLCSQSQGLVNAYLHVTYACNLACDHCYAHSSPTGRGLAPSPTGMSKGAGGEGNPMMAVDDVAHLVREAAKSGFGKAIITGGEPMAHPQRDALLDALAGLRQEVKPLQVVLRTNLAYSLSPGLLEQLARSADQIVVSIDGDKASHDARRGTGMYARTVSNLRQICEVLRSTPERSGVGETSRVSIAATLTAEQSAGSEGDAVRALGQELDVPVRFKPVLPLGRAAGQVLAPEYYPQDGCSRSSLEDDSELLAYATQPRSTCGLGMNLYITPDGKCYPCYALMGEQHYLGNALADGMAVVLAQNDVYRCITVDSNQQCRHCALRYLCGGFCRAWSNGDGPDASPTDCAALYQRAQSLLMGALEALNVSAERWIAGLPILKCPPKIFAEQSQAGN